MPTDPTDTLRQTDILRQEYRRLRRETVKMIGYYSFSEFDDDVKAKLSLFKLEPTPGNWVYAALEQHREATREVERYEEYQAEQEAATADKYMGYDTLEERNMDREWDCRG